MSAVSSIPQVLPSAEAVGTAVQTPLEAEVARLLVEALNLETAPHDIEPEAPLYGDGLGLDSIDILEVALVVSQRYGLQLRSDDERNHLVFRSLRSLAGFVAEHRGSKA